MRRHSIRRINERPGWTGIVKLSTIPRLPAFIEADGLGQNRPTASPIEAMIDKLARQLKTTTGALEKGWRGIYI
jgi:hypothetical protein